MNASQSTPRDPKKYLYDIKEACELIKEFAGELSVNEYVANKQVQSACLMQFVIIGEALARLRDYAPAIFLKIEDGQRIIDFRNIIAHGYDVIIYEVVWSIIQEKVDPLHAAVLDIIDESSP